jgi:hypothetical protein
LFGTSSFVEGASAANAIPSFPSTPLSIKMPDTDDDGEGGDLMDQLFRKLAKTPPKDHSLSPPPLYSNRAVSPKFNSNLSNQQRLGLELVLGLVFIYNI